MSIRRRFMALAGLLSVLRSTAAERVCGGDKTTYPWTVRSLEYDAGAPETSARGANSWVFANLVLADSPYASFECFVQWPTAWAGWYEGGNRLVWADCINNGTSAGPNREKAVSFAVDWKAQILYLAHTFTCSDREFETLATGSVALNSSVECRSGREGEKACQLKAPTHTTSTPSISVTTVQILSRPEQGCPGGPKAYYSWQVEEWRRRYETTPPDAGFAPSADAGPSFKLHAMVTGETFTCQPSSNQRGVVEGTCKRGSDFSRTTARFAFDPRSDLLNVTQHWDCGNSTMFDASGAGYIQPMCTQQSSNRVVHCASAPIWIGSKAF